MNEQAEGVAERIEVADELVDVAAITDGKAVVRFSRTEHALADLRSKYANVTFDLTTTKGDAAARAARKELVTLRTGLEAKRKQLKAPATEFARRIDSEAARITTEIQSLELPIDAAIKQDEARREHERQMRIKAEEDRCNAHRARIFEINAVATRAVGLPSAEIQAKLDLVTRIAIDDSFEEFKAAAINAKAEVILRLTELLSAAKQQEERDAQAQRDREELARLQAAELQRQEAEAKARKEREEAEAAERQARELREAEERRVRAAREKQSSEASNLVDEIRRVQRRALTSSAVGLLELCTLIENIRPGDELGDFIGIVQKAKDEALSDLHQLHESAVAREAEKREAEARARDVEAAQEAERQRLAAIAEDLRREKAELEAARRPAAEPELAPVDLQPEPPAEQQLTEGQPLQQFDSIMVSGNQSVTTEMASPLTPIVADVPETLCLLPVSHSDPDPAMQALFNVLSAAAAIAKHATPGKPVKARVFTVPAADIDLLRMVLPQAKMFNGIYYAGDGTLMNADGTRSIFDDVDE